MGWCQLSNYRQSTGGSGLILQCADQQDEIDEASIDAFLDQRQLYLTWRDQETPSWPWGAAAGDIAQQLLALKDDVERWFLTAELIRQAPESAATLQVPALAASDSASANRSPPV